LDPAQLHLQLLKVQEAADVARRAQSEYLTDLSHEVRTAMCTIIGMTDEVLGTELNAEQRTDLTAVKDSANSLLKIIEDTLEWFKIAER
jgi:two-component system sensor histidine kinase/response regulator